MAQIATIPTELEDALKRFKGTSPPLVCMIDRKTVTLKQDTTIFDDDEEFSVEELASRLPDAPRFIVMNYKPEGNDFPKVVLIDWIPSGCETAASMLHVGTLPAIERLTRFPKVIQVTDGEEGLTPEILDAKLRR